MTDTIKFIDLFAGIGGIRLGFEQACEELGYVPECVFTSEIKPGAINVYKQNHPGEQISGDITAISPESIPDFDYLLGGFPCQAFSVAGKRLGFADTRGTLFFNVADILRVKRPRGFLLENVPGLVSHDGGKTFATILSVLSDLGYHTSWKVLDASKFGVPQARRRVYITGTLMSAPDIDEFDVISPPTIASILENSPVVHIRPSQASLRDVLLAHYTPYQMRGMKFSNHLGIRSHTYVHAWDFGLYGHVSDDDKALLELIANAAQSPIYRTDDIIGYMPLTAEQISGIAGEDVSERLENLEHLDYLYKCYPKTRSGIEVDVYGYAIAHTGGHSWQIKRIIDPDGISTTLTATDASKVWIPDGDTIRPFTMRECMRICGYPDSYRFDVPSANIGYDLIGNTVCPPVIKAVAERLLAV